MMHVSISSVTAKSSRSLATLLLAIGVAIPSVLAADKPQTFTGKVSDAMCGVNHNMMPGEAAACVHSCVQKGSKYALVVGNKVYALDTSDKTALGELDKLADHQAQVSGQANGDTITVSSVAAAK
jgi:hypothetical protein